MSKREIVACVLLLACGIALLPFVGGGVLWTHPLWTDELCCTLFPAQHATSPAGVVANLAKSHDLAPPLLHLVVWTAAKVAGGMTPALLRSISLVSMSVALVLVYATLRRAFTVAASAAGALAIASHPLVLTHAFEGRFYGLWMMLAAGFALSVGRRRRVGQAVFAVGLASIHWFGVISLGFMAAAVVATHGRDWRAGLRSIAPSAAGAVALLAYLPLLRSQMGGLSVSGWLEELNRTQLFDIARLFFLAVIPVVALAILAVEALRRGRPGAAAVADRVRNALDNPGVASLASLAAMPLAFVVVSLAFMPAMLDRYMITTVLCWAPLVAIAVASLGRVGSGIAVVALLVPFVPNVQRSISLRQGYTSRVTADSIGFAHASSLGIPVAWRWIHGVYPVLGPRAGAAPGLLLDVPDSALAVIYPGDDRAWLRRLMRVEANMARSHTRVYGFPSVITSAELDTVTRFAIMTSDVRVPRSALHAEFWARVVFPHHAMVRIDDHVALFERAPK